MNRVPLKMLLPACAMFSFFATHGQLTLPEKQLSIQSLTEGNTVFRSFDDRYAGVKGGTTLLQEWAPGKITMTRGQVFSHDKINYDAFNGELIVLRDDREAVVNVNMVKDFVLNVGADTLHFTRLPGADGKLAFFQKLVPDAKVGLYKKVYKILVEPDYKGAYSTGRNYAEFISEEKFFCVVPGKGMKELKSKKNLLEEFPDHKDALNQFIKKEKIDFKNQNDLKNLFVYLNKLFV
jgi:hypothetical protein